MLVVVIGLAPLLLEYWKERFLLKDANKQRQTLFIAFYIVVAFLSYVYYRSN